MDPYQNHNASPSHQPSDSSTPPSRIVRTNTADSEGEGGRSKKRARQALACSECHRRKIKCDRNYPCGACVRKHPKFCLQYVSREDFDNLARRVAYLERKFGGANGSDSPDAGDTQDGRPTKTNAADDLLNSDTEEAAMALEELSVDKRLLRRSLREPSNQPESSTTIFSPNSQGMPLSPEESRDPSRSHGQSTSAPADAPNTWKPCVAPYKPPVRDPQKSRRVHPVESHPAVRRDSVLDSVFASLPTRPIAEALVDEFFELINWEWPVLHQPSFRGEHESYWAFVSSGRAAEIDPLWLGVYCMVLCLGASCVEAGPDRNVPGLDPVEVQDMADIFFEASQRALALGGWASKPKVWGIQTILLFGPYLQAVGRSIPGRYSDMFSMHLACSIRMAQILGWNCLGRDPNSMPPDDPAWPPGRNMLKREMAKRIWQEMIKMDWLAASGRLGAYIIKPDQFDTDDPLNLNDEDLSSSAVGTMSQPLEVITDVTYPRLKYLIAIQQRKVADALCSDTVKPSYGTILSLDKGFRDLLNLLPKAPASRQSSSRFLLQNYGVTQGIHHRLIRLHRPFMGRGYRDKRFEFSTTACVEAARIVLANQRSLAGTRFEIFWFTMMHCLAAATVVFTDAWHGILHGRNPETVSAEREDLHSALRTFQRSEYIRNRVSHARRGRALVEAMLKELARFSEAQRSGEDSLPAQEETFAAATRRIAASTMPLFAEDGELGSLLEGGTSQNQGNGRTQQSASQATPSAGGSTSTTTTEVHFQDPISTGNSQAGHVPVDGMWEPFSADRLLESMGLTDPFSDIGIFGESPSAAQSMPSSNVASFSEPSNANHVGRATFYPSENQLDRWEAGAGSRSAADLEGDWSAWPLSSQVVDVLQRAALSSVEPAHGIHPGPA